MDVEELIEAFQSQIQGQLVEKGRVSDHLLDLRLAAAGDSYLTAKIDSYLGSVPGVTTVSAQWWRKTLSDIQEMTASAVLSLDVPVLADH